MEFSHHEGGPGQNEIDLRYADALQTADNIMTFRTVIKEVALQQGTYATFMPKPFTDHPGSGMHTHFSLFEGTPTHSLKPAPSSSCPRLPANSLPVSSSTLLNSPQSPISS